MDIGLFNDGPHFQRIHQRQTALYNKLFIQLLQVWICKFADPVPNSGISNPIAIQEGLYRGSVGGFAVGNVLEEG